MELLNKKEMANILGGRYICLPDGTIVYYPGDEEGDEDDIIYV